MYLQQVLHNMFMALYSIVRQADLTDKGHELSFVSIVLLVFMFGPDVIIPICCQFINGFNSCPVIINNIQTYTHNTKTGHHQLFSCCTSFVIPMFYFIITSYVLFILQVPPLYFLFEWVIWLNYLRYSTVIVFNKPSFYINFSYIFCYIFSLWFKIIKILNKCHSHRWSDGIPFNKKLREEEKREEKKIVDEVWIRRYFRLK